MNKWNYIFPKDSNIIIWGAGKKGREWLNFLKEINRNVKCFFDIKVQGYLEDIPIYQPQKNSDSNCVLLISPLNGIDLIFEQARNLGFHNIQIGAVLEGFSNNNQEKNTELSLKDLFLINFQDEDTRRYDIVVRYLAIENYYGKNDYGFQLYKKMQELRTKKDGYGALAVKQFKKLIESYDKNGYDKESRINVFDNLKLLDGSHRMALGLYHHLKNISIRILPKEESIDFSLKWFEENNFIEEEINIIKNKGDELLNEWKIAEFTGVFWGSTLSFVEEAINDLRNFGIVTNILHHEYRREEYNNLIRKIYAIDDIASWKVDKKIYHLSKYPAEIVLFNLKMEPGYRIKQISNLPLSIKGEEVKKFIRSKYQDYFENYYYDVILHMSDNSYQSDYIQAVLSPKIDLNEILKVLSEFPYALLNVDVPYTPDDFPNVIPIGKDIDILVLSENYKTVVSYLKQMAVSYSKQYEIRILEKSIVNTCIRYEKYGQLILQIDISCEIEGLIDDFVIEAISTRIKKKNYFILKESYEYIYRLIKYSKNKSKWWHYKYLFDNKNVYNKKIAMKYFTNENIESMVFDL